MAGTRDWYVYKDRHGSYYVVDLLDGHMVRHMPASHRDIAQATLRGKFREAPSLIGN